MVGQSCDADGNCRAFVWHDGRMRDLNELVVNGYGDVLTAANDIDDFGRITGQAFDDEADANIAFVATLRFDR